MTRDGSPGPAPLDERVCDLACWVFAGWTVACHAVVAAGGSFAQLLGVAALGGLAALVAWLRGRRSPPRAAADGAADDPGDDQRVDGPPARLGWGLRIAGGLLGAAGVVFYLRTGDVVLLWGCGAGGLALALVAALRGRAEPAETPVHGAARQAALWAIAIGCGVVAWVASRPDIDDAFYVNVAVSAVDFPDRPLLAADTVHGIPGLPLHLPIYRVHSYELWNALISRLTGLPAIASFHFVSAAIAALLLPLAHARLFRLLTPQHWLASVATLVVVLVGSGETHWWYGNFALVRIWQGKAVFLSALLPLLLANGIDYGLRPTRTGWWRLAAAQIAAVGVTSSALAVAPLAALLSIATATGLGRAGWRRLLIGGLASFYVVGVALWVRADTVRAVLGAAAAPPSGEALVKTAVTMVLGSHALLVVALLAIVACWSVLPGGLAQRFAIVFPAAAFAVVLDPRVAPWWRAHATGPSYWRSLWAVPVPIVLTLFLTAPLALGGARRRWIGVAACLVAVASFWSWTTRIPGLSLDNGVELRAPSLKVHRPEHEAATLLSRLAPAAGVLAPPLVSAWIPTSHRHAFPLSVRTYLQANRAYPAADADERAELGRLVDGATDLEGRADRLRRGLARWDLRAVCLRRVPGNLELRAVVAEAGFVRSVSVGPYEIWAPGGSRGGRANP